MSREVHCVRMLLKIPVETIQIFLHFSLQQYRPGCRQQFNPGATEKIDLSSFRFQVTEPESWSETRSFGYHPALIQPCNAFAMLTNVNHTQTLISSAPNAATTSSPPLNYSPRPRKLPRTTQTQTSPRQQASPPARVSSDFLRRHRSTWVHFCC